MRDGDVGLPERETGRKLENDLHRRDRRRRFKGHFTSDLVLEPVLGKSA